MIIDTHSHLDDKKYLHDLDEVLNRAKKAGVGKIIIPAANPADLIKAQNLAKKHKEIYFAIGVHPYYAKDYDKNYLLRFASDPKCIAVGECGLDYYRLPKDTNQKEQEIKLQKEVFIAQIKLAIELKKPLIVHIRESSIDAKDLLLLHDIKSIGGVLHCFNGDKELLELAKYNFYFGIGGVITFKNAQKLKDIVKDIPLEKIVLETDAPYLSPEPYRGKRNEPAYTTFVLKKVSEILNQDANYLKTIICNNTTNLFKDLFK